MRLNYKIHKTTLLSNLRLQLSPIRYNKWTRLILLLIINLLASKQLIVNAANITSIDPAKLYQHYCSVCHGDRGDGNSHAKQGLVPPPRDFTSPKSAIELNQKRIIHAIKTGVPGTAMVAWKATLSDLQIKSLAKYIQQNFLRSSTVTSATQGSRIYADYCSVCHGDTGKGAVWATAGLRPRPVDFTNTKKQTQLNLNRMIKSVAYGRPETAMTAWKGRLTDAQIATVVNYIINTFMSDKKIIGHNNQASSPAMVKNTKADMTLALPNKFKGDFNRGAALYQFNCTACHGIEGDGRGPRAYFINPKPRNFLHPASRASLNLPTLYQAIKKGKLRSEMPAWQTVLNKQQLADVSKYVFKKFIQEK
ncbi:Cytochrome c oxidase polypeptide II [hydrothermal vent metagenome]|uniref:Cytochrome c oxidase polypeptide II n=1 Tax=hydrothermal vent metagenome TaxID=652676 RepID=A0A3B1APY4_9ZZZZ